MIKPPPDPDAAAEAELRAEDDGMPEHPEKAADPVAWAESQVEREKAHAAGYPNHPVGRAFADLMHSVSRLANHIRPPKRASPLSLVAAGVGIGLAVYLLSSGGRQRRRRSAWERHIRSGSWS